MTINVLVVDDSAVVRQVLQAILNEARDIQVVAVASDPIFARQHMQKQWPDVIVLDMEMPRMDGLEACRRLRQHAAHVGVRPARARPPRPQRSSCELTITPYVTCVVT